MEVIVSVTRKKMVNTIVENFMISPQHSFLIDNKRKMKKLLWKFISHKSISNKYELLNIIKVNFNTTFIMKFDNKPVDFKLFETYKFLYNPILGEKNCNKCRALKIFNNERYCRTKSKKINKNSWWKCQEWQENVEIQVI